MEWILNTILTILFYMFRIFPIKKNKVVVSNFAGKGYGDNGKYIVNKLLEKKKDLDIVWVCSEANEELPEGVRLVLSHTLYSIYEQVTAKVWIDNIRKPIFVRKRKKQYYIMTWHANPLIMKKVEKDVIETLSPEYIKRAKRDSKMADLFLASNKNDVYLYRESFWYKGEILESGEPKKDILLLQEEDTKKRIREKLKINQRTKVLLYAPTFRDEVNCDYTKVYNVDWEKVMKALECKFGGNWVVLARLHPNLPQSLFEEVFPDYISNVSSYSDIQELLLVSDCLITDYSSVLIDFGILRRPGFIFASDITQYLKERNFYFDFNKLPFAISKNNQELINNIYGYEQKKHIEMLDNFYSEICGDMGNGNASEIVAEKIVSVIEKSD